MVAPKLIMTAVLTVANIALNASRKIEGPQLDDLSFSGGDPGGPRPRFWGRVRGSKQAIWGDKLRRVKRRRKTKGGKYNDYSYYGDWAVDVACHPIDGVSRIWADGHLIYDLTGAGPVMPFDFGENHGGIPTSDFITIYTGEETQEPDPTIEAETDARIGIEGATPAYRDTAMIVFRLPLGKFGNRIPQIDVEAVKNANASFPYEVRTNSGIANSVRHTRVTPDGSRLYVFGDTVEIWDTASRSLILTGSANGYPGERMTVDADGNLLGQQGSPATIGKWSPDLTSFIPLYTTTGTNWQEFPVSVQDGNGEWHIYSSPYSNLLPFFFDGSEFEMSDLTGVEWSPNDCFVDPYGDVWIAGAALSGSGTTAYLYRIVSTGTAPETENFITIEGLPSTDQSTGNIKGEAYEDHFIIAWGSPATLHIVARDGSITTSRPGASTANREAIINRQGNAATVWAGTTEVSLADLSTVRTVSDGSWISNSDASALYDPVNHALIGLTIFGGQLTWRYLDRIGSNGVTLGTIVGEVCELCGMEAGDYDASALTQSIEGYSVSAGDAKTWLYKLLELYDVDARPHGFVLEFVQRGGASTGRIEAGKFARPSDPDAPFYDFEGQGGTDVPRSVVLNFSDADADQQPNTAQSPIVETQDGADELVIELGNLVLTADEARQLVARYHRRRAFDARLPSIALPASQIALEPADIKTLGMPSGDILARQSSIVVGADGRIDCEWYRDDPSVALLDGADGAGKDAHVPAEIVVPLPSKGFVLDIPLLYDSDDGSSPVLQVAAAPYADGAWPGAVLFAAVDGEYSEEVAEIPAGEGASWGSSTDALGDANPWLWDRGNSVNVVLQTGELTSASEAAIEANETLNRCLLGGEILQFSTATLEGDGSYTLSGFLRGRRGTEWATGDHGVRDVFLLLDTADALETELSRVGTDLSYKAVTLGRTDGFPITVPFTGASLKPYAPVDLQASKDASGDWTFSWVRRTRVGGAWTSGTPIPLGEASEEYQITVGDGVSSDTKTVTSATYTWTVAQQTTDTGAEVLAGSLEWSVAQVSDAVGAGFVATA